MICLQVISGRGPTGPAAAALADTRALLAAGVRVAVACGARAPAIVEALEGAGVSRDDIFPEFQFHRGLRGALALPGEARRLSKLSARLHADVVHVHRAAEHWLGALAFGKACRKKVVRTFHRDPAAISGVLLRTLVGQTAGFVCVAREHESVLNRLRVSCARYLPSAVDTELFAPATIKSNTPVVVGHVGRWKIGKDHVDRGQGFTLAVFSKLPINLNWRGVVAGRGELESNLHRWAFDDLKLQPERVSIVSTQEMNQQAFAEHIRGLSLGLVFETGSDGGSRPALEMLASGVPLLVAPMIGLRELAEDRDCAQIGPAGRRRFHAAKWAEEVAALIRSPERLAAMQRAARERALAAHSFKARGAALREFYGECVATNQSRDR